ncbi:phage head-tail connector protein [Staphylococcus xylosus]
MDVKEVKILNSKPLDDHSHDEEIEAMITIYKGMAEEHCNNKFKVPYPSGVKKFIADCIKYGETGNIASRSMGSVSYSFVTDLPETLYKPLTPYRKLKW